VNSTFVARPAVLRPGNPPLMLNSTGALLGSMLLMSRLPGASGCSPRAFGLVNLRPHEARA
jgi:hypothetical protein